LTELSSLEAAACMPCTWKKTAQQSVQAALRFSPVTFCALCFITNLEESKFEIKSWKRLENTKSYQILNGMGTNVEIMAALPTLG